MSVRRFSGILALSVLLAACSDDATTNAVTAPEASFDTGSDVATLLESLLPTLPATAAPAQLGPAQAATGGRASGHAHITPFANFNTRYSFVAVSTGSFPDAKGEFEGSILAGPTRLDIHADVDCLATVGDQAWVSGPIERFVLNGEPQPIPPFDLLFRVRDNGEGGNSPPDEASTLSVFGEQPCAARFNTIMRPNERGNIQVRPR